MSRIDGIIAAREVLLDVAKLAAAAAYRAPMLTGTLDLKTEIITDEDQDALLEFFEATKKIYPVMHFDYETLKYFRDRNETIPILLLGADLRKSELGWDCGACGFKTCMDFNDFSKKSSKIGNKAGPTCNWKLLDFAAACDFACATVAQHRFDCRAMGTVGSAAAAVGFLPKCSFHIGIPIGPAGDFIYFSRSQNLKTKSYEDHIESLKRTSPTNWQSFPGSTKPCFKSKQDWWNNMEYINWEPMQQKEQEIISDSLQRISKIAEKHFKNISSWYDK